MKKSNPGGEPGTSCTTNGNVEMAITTLTPLAVLFCKCSFNLQTWTRPRYQTSDRTTSYAFKELNSLRGSQKGLQCEVARAERWKGDMHGGRAVDGPCKWRCKMWLRIQPTQNLEGINFKKTAKPKMDVLNYHCLMGVSLAWSLNKLHVIWITRFKKCLRVWWDFAFVVSFTFLSLYSQRSEKLLGIVQTFVLCRI